MASNLLCSSDSIACRQRIVLHKHPHISSSNASLYLGLTIVNTGEVGYTCNTVSSVSISVNPGTTDEMAYKRVDTSMEAFFPIHLKILPWYRTFPLCQLVKKRLYESWIRS